MTKEQRKERAELHKKLIDLLTDTDNDVTYLYRLIWANQIIANALSTFDDIQIEEREE